MCHGSREKHVERDAVPADQQAAFGLEGRSKCRDARVSQRRAPALDLDRNQTAARLDDEVDLLVAFSPIVQLAAVRLPPG